MVLSAATSIDAFAVGLSLAWLGTAIWSTVATSIDAFAVGLSLAWLGTAIWSTVAVIGIVTI